ncbi:MULTISPECIES: hypothetical protein [Paenibacillus]|uniref:hypothetical protein n=1 Tax=Paenibacillus TaxID=44249 RepID=UPI0022B8C548|nr:hypothetical protein [Paenibacillus caseinilyticus]MCZ8522173.1 hypothetical protein [Paenibacillus caseinilyticus]
MRNLKKSAATLVVSAILASVAVVGSASAETPTVPTAPRVKVNPGTVGSGGINPLETRKPIDNQNIAYRTQDNINFDIPAGFGMVKVFVHNTGVADIKVTVLNPNGTVKMSGTVVPGGTFNETGSSAWGTGKHSVSLTSPEDMSGTVSVKLAETSQEL